MSGGSVCVCKGTKEERMKNWRVVQYKCNHSAFNGYHRTSSDYSEVSCDMCQFRWRTKANYVYRLLNKKDTNESNTN